VTKAEAVAFLNGVTPTTMDVAMVDKVKWGEFKVLALAALNAPVVDPKWEQAVRAIDAIDDALLH